MCRQIHSIKFALGLPYEFFFLPLSLLEVIRFKRQSSTVTVSYMLIMSIVVHENIETVGHTVRYGGGLVIEMV